MAVKQRVKAMDLPFRYRGGNRRGSGRKPAGEKPLMPRDKRPALRGADLIHITVRLLDGLPSLRQGAEGRALLKAFQGGKNRFGFRLVHFSIQRTHLHLIVEAEDRRSLSRGMTGLQVRITRALNKLWNRSGQAFLDRYHEHILKTPTEVRNALAYVLHNAKKHEGALHVKDLDEFTSARAFDGWKETVKTACRAIQDAIVQGRTWLLTEGWKRLGLLSTSNQPGRRPV